MHTARVVGGRAVAVAVGMTGMIAAALSASACVKTPPEPQLADAGAGAGVAAASATASAAAPAPAPTASAAGRDARKRATLAYKDGKLWACYETPGVVDDSKTPDGWVSVPGKLCLEAVTDQLELASCRIQVNNHPLIAHYYQLHGVEKDDCKEKSGTWQETPDAGAKPARPDAGVRRTSGT
jgi:hypothetical protein